MDIKELCKVSCDDWTKYASDPLPGWGSRNFTLFDTQGCSLESTEQTEIGICSIPFDSTASTRIGSRHGPMAIRKASLAYSAQQSSRNVNELYHMQTGKKMQVLNPVLRDYGDLHVYPTDPVRQIRSLTAECQRIMMNSERLLILGGEHTISIGGYYGVANAVREKSGKKLGYIQIDHHFDYGDNSVLHGPVYHGSNGRRIAEHPDLSPMAMGFVGVGDLTSVTQYDMLIKSGVAIEPMYKIRENGFAYSLKKTIEQVLEHCDEIYISVDVDVCDTSVLHGTGHITIGGISALEFLSMASVLQQYPVRALDVVEVSPDYDPSGASAGLVARLLFEWLFLKEQ